MANEMLLINEGFDGFFEFELKEGQSNGAIKFKGKFQEAEAINKNKRMYPFAVLDDNVHRLQEVIDKRGLVGELDHPADSIIHFKDASHVITKLWWDGNVLMGEGEVLTTPHGRVLQALLNCGVRVGISSRGVGNGKVNNEGVLVIGDSYRLITFDAVADPSTFAAFQERVTGSKREAYVPREQNSVKNSVKNESSRIHKLSSALVIAGLSGAVKAHTGKVIKEMRTR